MKGNANIHCIDVLFGNIAMFVYIFAANTPVYGVMVKSPLSILHLLNGLIFKEKKNEEVQIFIVLFLLVIK